MLAMTKYVDLMIHLKITFNFKLNSQDEEFSAEWVVWIKKLRGVLFIECLIYDMTKG